KRECESDLGQMALGVEVWRKPVYLGAYHVRHIRTRCPRRCLDRTLSQTPQRPVADEKLDARSNREGRRTDRQGCQPRSPKAPGSTRTPKATSQAAEM